MARTKPVSVTKHVRCKVLLLSVYFIFLWFLPKGSKENKRKRKRVGFHVPHTYSMLAPHPPPPPCCHGDGRQIEVITKHDVSFLNLWKTEIIFFVYIWMLCNVSNSVYILYLQYFNLYEYLYTYACVLVVYYWICVIIKLLAKLILFVFAGIDCNRIYKWFINIYWKFSVLDEKYISFWLVFRE